jgi:oligo-alginate lyase
MKIFTLLVITILFNFYPDPLICQETFVSKTSGVFYTREKAEKAKANAARYEWAAKIRDSIINEAQPWKRFSDDDLWRMMFGNTITRSWMVWSDGYCPACKKDVPMYNWEINAFEHPWKVRCPHCKELFPKNDFYRFYQSGLDEHGVFDPKRADKKLLYNEDHPKSYDPLHLFGVDDGEGYVEGDKRWRFIGAYLIYGQWKQLIVSGITKMAAAYFVTGDGIYAHKAGVLLDRVADLYPTFDFRKEGIVYEKQGEAGYVSTWHDACEETRALALAYDQIFDGLKNDKELVKFLSGKAKDYKLDNPKSIFTSIQKNIEDGILNDAIANPQKIRHNYPRPSVTLITLKTILEWPNNRDEIYFRMDEMVERSTYADGMSGEKGLDGYSTAVPQSLGQILARYSLLEPGFLKDMVKRHPQLHDTWRFHIDTWINGEYYPHIGDCGGFATRSNQYSGLSITQNPGLEPSMFTFLLDLYKLTGDKAFVQVLYKANGNTVTGLPYDLFTDNPEKFQKEVQDIIGEVGSDIKVGCINKQKWCLDILRDGSRAVWLDYDTSSGKSYTVHDFAGAHSHADGMSIGLYAFGLDLMPDFGYPPVQYGGWHSPRSHWYSMTASHNTVVIDGFNLQKATGKTTLWDDGEQFKVIRASAPEMINGKQYERTIALVDISDSNFYLFDVFRVIGGTDHAKFFHSHFGTITTSGLSLSPAGDYGNGTQMRSFAIDPSPKPGWYVDWKIEDFYNYLPKGSDIHLRYTDLTKGAEAYTCQGWLSVGGYGESGEAWIPRIMVRRTSAAKSLTSTFVSVIEPYEHTSGITGIRRLPIESLDGVMYPDQNAAVEVELSDGRRDLIVAADVENPMGLVPSRAVNKVLVQKEWELSSDAELCMVRRDSKGEIQRIVICGGKIVQVGTSVLKLKKPSDFFECRFDKGKIVVVSGKVEEISEVKF